MFKWTAPRHLQDEDMSFFLIGSNSQIVSTASLKTAKLSPGIIYKTCKFSLKMARTIWTKVLKSWRHQRHVLHWTSIAPQAMLRVGFLKPFGLPWVLWDEGPCLVSPWFCCVGSTQLGRLEKNTCQLGCDSQVALIFFNSGWLKNSYRSMLYFCLVTNLGCSITRHVLKRPGEVSHVAVQDSPAANATSHLFIAARLGEETWLFWMTWARANMQKIHSYTSVFGYQYVLIWCFYVV